MSDIESALTPEKRTVPVLLYERDLRQLEQLAAQWGTSLAGAVRHLIRGAENKPKREEIAA